MKVLSFLLLIIGLVSCGSPSDNDSASSLDGDTSIRYATYYNCRQAGQCASGVYGRDKLTTASGERFSPNGYTAAHNVTPFGTILRVTNRENGRFVFVCINDRGGMKDSVIDLSEAAFRAISSLGAGRIGVSVQTLGKRTSCGGYGA